MAELTLIRHTFTCRTCGFQWQSKSHRACRECGALWGDTPAPAAPGPYIALRDSPGRGLGVYATEDIPCATVIERCPAFVSVTNIDAGPSTEEFLSVFTEPFAPGGDGVPTGEFVAFRHLVVPWRRDNFKAVLLGFGMLYNHSGENWNTVALPYVDPNTQRRYMDFVTWHPVPKGEEFLVNYGEQLWFIPNKEEKKEREPMTPEEGVALQKVFGEHEKACIDAGELGNKDPNFSKQMLGWAADAEKSP